MFPDIENLLMSPPSALAAIESDTETLGFDMPSIRQTGALLRALASSRQKARFLELGTGTGIATCWILDGMDEVSRLITVDNDPQVQTVARRHLEWDTRLTVVNEDAAKYLENEKTHRFDFIFADAWPGKFTHLEDALRLLSDGGLYVVDDLLPQSSWPKDHAPRVPAFIDRLRSRADLEVDFKEWSTGILIAKKLIQAR